MNTEKQIARGLRLIEDAKYIYDTFIPLALCKGMWNLVLFECQRSTELLIKGIIKASGFDFKKTHDLSGVLPRFREDLVKRKFSYVRSIQDNEGNRYFFWIGRENVDLYLSMAGKYYLLGSANIMSPYIPISIEKVRSHISVSQGKSS